MNRVAGLPPFTPYTFGAMRVGCDERRLSDDIRLVRRAMEAGVWIHASPTYNQGNTFTVLRLAFDESPRERRPIVIKIRDLTPAWLRFDVEDTCRRLGVERVDIAQLRCLTTGPGGLVDDFVKQGPLWECCEKLRKEGKVGAFFLNSFRRLGDDVPRAVEKRLFDGIVIFLSPWEREASDDVFRRMQEQGYTILAMRTLAEGVMFPGPRAAALAKSPNDSRVRRADALAPLLAPSGCPNWAEFSLRYLASVRQVVTSIGGTGSPDHLREFLEGATKGPLNRPIVEKIEAILSDRFLAT